MSKEIGEEHFNQLILFENQKKGICNFYECCDSLGNQYPDCNYGHIPCYVAKLQELLRFINQERNCQ